MIHFDFSTHNEFTAKSEEFLSQRIYETTTKNDSFDFIFIDGRQVCLFFNIIKRVFSNFLCDI